MQTIPELLSSVTPANLIDIVIIAALIYLILAWFRGTRAYQILATLIGIGVFYFVASKAGLVLTSILFQYLWAAIIVVLVIVFQPEIRQLLDRASPFRYLSGLQTDGVDPGLIEQIVLAVAELARTRTGALIVLQRLDRLHNVILTEKVLDAFVSAESIVMVFQKTSPLHDGAILIRGDRIKAAGCILPLSRDEGLSSRYGTRHRAALGLTERSDALCVVVSEERGEVALVEGKEISTFRKKGNFRQALDNGLSLGMPQPATAPRSIATLVGANWRLKALSVAVAALLWFVVVGPQKSEVGMSVPIQYTNLPQAMEITGKWMDRIDVRVRGSESGLANLKPGSVRAVVDLGHVVPGLNYFRISAKNLLVPPGIAIAQIRPSDLHLYIETALIRKMPVIPSIAGALPERNKIVVAPAEVAVRAVQGDLKKMTSVTTEPISIAELVAKRKISIPVVIKPENLRVDSVDPAQVTIILEAEK